MSTDGISKNILPVFFKSFFLLFSFSFFLFFINSLKKKGMYMYFLFVLFFLFCLFGLVLHVPVNSFSNACMHVFCFDNPISA